MTLNILYFKILYNVLKNGNTKHINLKRNPVNHTLKILFMCFSSFSQCGFNTQHSSVIQSTNF